MAISGRETYYNYNNGGYGTSTSNYIYVNFRYAETVNQASNTSTIKVDAYVNFYSLSVRGYKLRIYWNDILKYDGYANAIQDYSGYAHDALLASTSFDIEHDATGKASGVIKVEWLCNPLTYGGVSYFEMGAKSVELNLTDIPRTAPVINSVTYDTSKFLNYIVAGYSDVSFSTVNVTFGTEGGSVSKYVVQDGSNIIFEGASLPQFKISSISEVSKTLNYTILVYENNSGLASAPFPFSISANRYDRGTIDIQTVLSKRCRKEDDDYIPDDEGEAANCYCEFRPSKIGGNAILSTVKATVNDISGSATTSPLNVNLDAYLDTAESYKVEYRFTDVMGYDLYYDIISLSFFAISAWGGGYSKDDNPGHGIAFGQKAIKNEFNVNYTTKINNGDLSINKIEGPINSILKQTDIGLEMGLNISSDSEKHGLRSNGYFDGETFNYEEKWLIYRDSDGTIHFGDVDDYIESVETTGNWTVRKWNSGLAECIYKKAYPGASQTNPTGYIYYANLGSISFPITFITPPSSFNSWVWHGTFGSNSQCGNITTTEISNLYISGPDYIQSLDADLSLYVMGRWK